MGVAAVGSWRLDSHQIGCFDVVELTPLFLGRDRRFWLFVNSIMGRRLNADSRGREGGGLVVKLKSLGSLRRFKS